MTNNNQSVRRPTKRSQKKEKQKFNEKEIFIIIMAAFVLIILAYVVRGMYYNRTGALRTETINYVTESKTFEVQGVAVRNENGTADNKTAALLKKTSDGIYSPIISDGDCVAKNQGIAYIFEDEKEAAQFHELEEIQSRLKLLGELEDIENIGYLDLSMVNSDIASSVTNFIKACDSNDLSDIDSKISNLCYKLTSKQIITGQEINFKSEISELTKRQNQLEKSINSKRTVNSPSAGYFVSDVDGYETVFDYNSVSKNGLTVSQIEKMKKSKPKNSDKYFGKIISEHAWYFLFNVEFKEVSSLKVGNTVSVSFPDKNISDVKMVVKSIKKDGDTAAVVLRCLTMNDNMFYLRNEKAVICTAVYSGFKISNSALKDSDVEGTMGVYANVGNVSLFKPVRVIYNDEDYVIVLPVSDYYQSKTDENKKVYELSKKEAELLEKEPEKSEYKKDKVSVNEKYVLRVYDKIIVKGMNLTNGKVVS